MARRILPQPTPTAEVTGPVQVTPDAPSPTASSAEHAIETGWTRAAGKNDPGAARTTPLPGAYRGKSSGEFQRVASHQPPDIEGLIAQAERLLATLDRGDRNRRLLEVAVLRRDAALLGGILEALRHAR